MPSERASRLSLVGASLVFASIVWGKADLLKTAAQLLSAKTQDGISAYEDRLAQVRRDTAADAVLGFVGDGDELVKYYQAEYSLAPRLLARATSERLILGVFDGPSSIFLREHHLKIVNSYGQGVLLLEPQP